MTTPAVNQNQSQSQTVTKTGTLYYKDGRVVQDAPSVKTIVAAEYQETRPASVRSPASASGWRQPTGWSHRVMRTVPNPLITLIETSVYPSTGWAEDKKVWIYPDGYGWPTRSTALPPFPSGMESRAIIKALTALKGQNVNLSQCFGERSQTARMFEDAINRIVKSVRGYKNRRPKDWYQVVKKTWWGHSKKLPQSWLETVYGWQPFCSDVDGAVKSLNDKEQDGDAYRATVYGNVSERSRLRNQLNPSNIHSGLGVFYDQDTSFGCRVRLDYVLENPLTATLAQLGIFNVASVAWELAPYSFIIDWAVPIGDYLNCMDASVGWTFLGGTCSRFTQVRRRGTGAYNKYPNTATHFFTMYGEGGTYQGSHVNLSRTVYDSSPLPRFPGIKNPLSTTHIANALALLSGSFR